MKTQQHDCYAAEGVLGSGRQFKSVGDVQKFVDALRNEPWWTSQGYAHAVLRIEVGAADGRKVGKAIGVGWYDRANEAGRIELRPAGLNMKTVVHEVAHVLASAQHRSKAHDPWWARTYLTLVSFIMGGDAYLTLQRSFDVHGVDYDVCTGRPGVIAL